MVAEFAGGSAGNQLSGAHPVSDFFFTLARIEKNVLRPFKWNGEKTVRLKALSHMLRKRVSGLAVISLLDPGPHFLQILLIQVQTFSKKLLICQSWSLYFLHDSSPF